MKHSILFGGVALFAVAAAPFVSKTFAQEWDATTTTATTTTTTVTGASGTIAQLNYGNDGEVQGFLIGTNILLSFPTNICGGVATLGVPGNSVTYSGTAFTASSGFESVRISSFKNNTTGATYTAPTSNSTTYGPTSGTVKQLNYTGNGSIDGFLFTAGGSTIFVSTGARASTTLTSLLTVGATVSVTGTTSTNMSACASTATLESVDASSLTIGSQTIVIAGGGNGSLGGNHP